MSEEEAIAYYYTQKQNGLISKTDLKIELGKSFEEDRVKYIIRQISEKELRNASDQSTVVSRALNSKGVSIFFIVFGLIAIGVSVYIIMLGREDINQFLPWIMIVGAGFIIGKHFRNLLG